MKEPTANTLLFLIREMRKILNLPSEFSVTINAGRHILPELGRRTAAKIKRSEVQQAVNAIATSPNCQSNSMVNKCLTQIRAVFEAAIDDEILELNPATKIAMPPTPRASQRFLTLLSVGVCFRWHLGATI
jgi:site-specific recombinase XerD